MRNFGDELSRFIRSLDREFKPDEPIDLTLYNVVKDSQSFPIRDEDSTRPIVFGVLKDDGMRFIRLLSTKDKESIYYLQEVN